MPSRERLPISGVAVRWLASRLHRRFFLISPVPSKHEGVGCSRVSRVVRIHLLKRILVPSVDGRLDRSSATIPLRDQQVEVAQHCTFVGIAAAFDVRLRPRATATDIARSTLRSSEYCSPFLGEHPCALADCPPRCIEAQLLRTLARFLAIREKAPEGHGLSRATQSHHHP